MIDRARDPKRVIDLTATKRVKQITGKLQPIAYEPKDSKWDAHVAGALSHVQPPKKSLAERASTFLGLDD